MYRPTRSHLPLSFSFLVTWSQKPASPLSPPSLSLPLCLCHTRFNSLSLSLCSGPSASYLHTANLLWGQLMLVFGGSCFSSNLMIYNIGTACQTRTNRPPPSPSSPPSLPTGCDEWYETDYLGLPGDAGRLGHVAFVDPSTSSLTVFGGFLGLPLADMFLFNTGLYTLLCPSCLLHVMCP